MCCFAIVIPTDGGIRMSGTSLEATSKLVNSLINSTFPICQPETLDLGDVFAESLSGERIYVEVRRGRSHGAKCEREP